MVFNILYLIKNSEIENDHNKFYTRSAIYNLTNDKIPIIVYTLCLLWICLYFIYLTKPMIHSILNIN